MRYLISFIIKNALTLTLIVLLILSFLLVTTEKGLHVTLWSIQHFTPIKLSVKKAHGTLYSSFSLEDVTYEDTHQDVHIDSFGLQWNPLGLLLNKLTLDKVELKHAFITLRATSSSPSAASFLNKLTILSVKEFKFDHLTIVKGCAQLTLNGIYKQQWNGEWQINIPDLSQFISNVKGSFYSDGKMKGTLLSPIITANLKAFHIRYNDYEVKAIKGIALIPLKKGNRCTLALTLNDIVTKQISFKKVIIKGTGNLNSNQTAVIQLAANIDNRYQVAGNFNFPQLSSLSDLTQPFTGKIIANTTYLEWITPLYQEIKEPKGKLEATLLLNGTLDHPVIDSHILLTQGQCKIPSIGIFIQHISLEAHQQKAVFILKGRLQSGGGMGYIEGMLPFDLSTPIVLTLQGNNLQCINLSEYKVNASPSIKLTFHQHLLKIEGDIPIISADILPKRFGTTVNLPEEVVFVEDHTRKIALPLDVAIRINLLLDKKIRVIYKDLQTYLKGKLTINWTPKGNTTAVGNLYAVNGTYTAYGQTLSILNGRLTYTGGSLNNPGLNIRAGKQVKAMVLGGQSSFDEKWSKPIYTGTETMTVGFQILGTFDNQTVSLFSNPSGLNQNDILSYLTFGYPQSQISDKQNKLLLKAASAVNFGGKQKWTNFTDKIQNKLGLSEMNVESTQVFNPAQGKIDSTTSFVVGKELFSNFYAHYSIGLFDPISTLNLRYQLSKRFAIQSETSQLGNGADLLYSIERD